MTTRPEQFRAWLDSPEGARLEFKTAKQTYQFDSLVEYCVALANEGGGQVILGVTDQRPREVIGTLAFQEPGRTEHGLFQRLRQRISIEEYHHEDRRVLIVHVPGRLPGTAWEVDGRYLKRAGDGLTALGGNELQAMFAETGPDFSAQPCPVTMSELEPAGIARFRERWAAREGWQRVLKLTDEALLEAAELARRSLES